MRLVEPIPFEHCEQGTDAWFNARLGHATASRFADILAEIKSGEAAARKNYRTELVCERLTGFREEGFISEPMRRGTEKEPYARTAYALRDGALLTQVGFMRHPELQWCGASLDSYLDEEGHIEIKCPNTAQHFDALLNGTPSKHKPQIQGQLWIRGPKAKWCDFVSFDDRVPEHLQLFVERIYRDDVYIAKLEAKVREFLGEVEATLEALDKRYGQLMEAA
jgi:hypothetical protein